MASTGSNVLSEDMMIERCTQAMKIFDINQDESLSLEDYHAALRDNAENVQYTKALKDFFAYLGLKNDKDEITIKESVKKARSSVKDQEFVTKTKALFHAMFDDLDIDGNGFLSPKEWQEFMIAIEMMSVNDLTKCEKIFKSMNLKDGHLSREEFVEMSFEYWFTGENKLSSDKMFGKQ